MNRRRLSLIATLVTIAIQIALAASALFPSVLVRVQHAIGSTKPESITVLVIGLQVALLSGLLAFQLLASQDTLETVSRRILADPNTATVSQVRDDDFYTDFLRHIKRATHTVLISYFNPHSPTTGAPPERLKYYEKLSSLVSSRPDIHFRRLIVKSLSNIQWLKAQVARLDKAVNLEIACISDAIPERGMPLPLSVQIVDGRHVWLVAIADHERTAKGYRDLYFSSERVADGFRDYYERLWSRAEVIYEKGMLTPVGRNMLGPHV